jgi:hypothetical protein
MIYAMNVSGQVKKKTRQAARTETPAPRIRKKTGYDYENRKSQGVRGPVTGNSVGF